MDNHKLYVEVANDGVLVNGWFVGLGSNLDKFVPIIQNYESGVLNNIEIAGVKYPVEILAPDNEIKLADDELEIPPFLDKPEPTVVDFPVTNGRYETVELKPIPSPPPIPPMASPNHEIAELKLQVAEGLLREAELQVQLELIKSMIDLKSLYKASVKRLRGVVGASR